MIPRRWVGPGRPVRMERRRRRRVSLSRRGREVGRRRIRNRRCCLLFPRVGDSRAVIECDLAHGGVGKKNGDSVDVFHNGLYATQYAVDGIRIDRPPFFASSRCRLPL